MRPEQDMTVIGAALALLQIVKHEEFSSPAEYVAALEESASRLEAAIAGPDWQAMAEQLPTRDGDLEGAVDMLLERGDVGSSEESVALYDQLQEVYTESVERHQSRVSIVAQALEAAYIEGQITQPLERIARIGVDDKTVLCFELPEDFNSRQMEGMHSSLRALADRICKATGVRPPMMMVPHGTTMQSIRLDDNPPTGVRVQVIVVQDGTWTVVLEMRPSHDGFTWWEHSWAGPVGSANLPSGVLEIARELVRSGHGTIVS